MPRAALGRARGCGSTFVMYEMRQLFRIVTKSGNCPLPALLSRAFVVTPTLTTPCRTAVAPVRQICRVCHARRDGRRLAHRLAGSDNVSRNRGERPFRCRHHRHAIIDRFSGWRADPPRAAACRLLPPPNATFRTPPRERAWSWRSPFVLAARRGRRFGLIPSQKHGGAIHTANDDLLARHPSGTIRGLEMTVSNEQQRSNQK